MARTIGIFAKTYWRAYSYLDELRKNMSDIKNVTRNRTLYTVELEDGTTYKVLPPNEQSRGSRLTGAHVQYGIKEKFLYGVIFPCLHQDEDLPEPTVIYFD